MGSEKLMIIDGNSILNRAFYGLQGANMLSTTMGVHTNAVFGFLNILSKFLDEEKPEFLCVAFDMKAPTFRHVEFEGYKAKRKGMPPELAEQMPIIKDVLDAMRIKRLELEGFEADDIIGSISLCAESAGMDVIIITGDKDSLQLATEKTRIKMPVTRGGRTETDEYDSNAVYTKYGVTPEQFIDVKGLMGDPSDNIPGVPGIGEKTALELIIRFKSIENIYEHIIEVEKKGVREKLIEHRELAYMSKRIATIDRNMPFLCNIADLKREEFDNGKLYEIFKNLEFKSLIDKYKLAAVNLQEKQKTQVTKADFVKDMEGLVRIKEAIRKAGKFSLLHLIDKTNAFESVLSGIVFSWNTGESSFVRIGEGLKEADFLREFKEVFENEKIQKTGHDLKPLIVYLKWKGISFNGLAFDTMIGAYIINPSHDSYSISQLMSEYLGITIEEPKDLAGRGKNFTLFEDMSDETLSASAFECCNSIFRISEMLDDLLNQYDQKELYYNLELPLVEVLADMEYRGFKVNTAELKAFSLELDEKIVKLTAEIYRLAGDEFNINSPKQLGVILFEKLGLPVIKKTKTGYSTDAEVLDQLASMNEVVTMILEYRQLVKLKSTYAEGLIGLVNPATERIHSSFNQTVAATGRISSTEPNLQNIPIKLEMGRKIRKVFVPENDNYLLSAADYSQIELRVLAHITGDVNMINAFKNNEDIHTATASGVFGIEKDQVTSLMRSRAKAVNFGIVYGIGDFSLAKDLGITRKEARKYIDEYLDRYQGVRQYMQDTVKNGKENGFVSTLLNRRRYLPELKSSNFNMRSFGERVAMNAPIQGSAADIIKIAMVKVYNKLNELGLKSKLILQVHDELIIETLKDEKSQVEKILKESMEKAIVLDVPLAVEVISGKNWYETK